MAEYTPKEGKGNIFKVRERKTEKSPHMTGNAMWKGEIIQISAWANLGDDGKVKSFGLSLQEPRDRDEKPAKQKSDDSDWGI